MLGLDALLDAIGRFALETIDTLGYTGVFLLMVAESMILPVPSEAVMPFAGFLAATGRMDFLVALLVSTAGTVVGSLLSYGMGVWGLRPALERWGRYVLVTPHHLDQAHRFFERGPAVATVFFSRFVPVVRHLISIPAGSARMPLGRFVAATAIGGGLWNLVLLYAGYRLGAHWEQIKPLLDEYRTVGLVLMALSLLVGAAVLWARRRRRGRRMRSEPLA